MEIDQFDALTRTLSSAGSSRRQALRALGSVLLGGSFGGVATRLGLTENAAAKPKKHGKRQDNRKRAGQLHAAGKKHNKHKDKNKHHDNPHGLCSNGKPKCPDGSCAPVGECCPGSRRCADGFCLSEDKCCDEEKLCDDGSCASQDDCCPGNVMCPDGLCIPYWECCDGDRQCDDLTCVGPGECCPGEKRCNGECLSADICCTETYPTCGGCEHVACAAGDWVCASGCEEDDEVCCGGQCVSTSCPSGHEFDPATCQCKAGLCPGGTQNYCNGGVTPAHCGRSDSHCSCLRNTAGATQCVDSSGGSSHPCERDVDCDAWYGKENWAVCEECSQRCIPKCRVLD
jgi:hypothetical protein